MGDDSSSNTVAKVKLPEVIDERVELAVVFGKTFPEMRIDSSALKRINSVGIRSLKTSLNRLRLEGANIILEGVTPPLMEAMDFISNLIPPNTVVQSVYLPYCCTSCGHTFMELQPAVNLTSRQEELETAVCTKCGKVAEFDNIPEVYFKKR